jgi:hypothetical protein
MLREIKGVSQPKGEPRRRWFDDEYFDLIVWYAADGGFFGFQLCYDRSRKPRALTWTAASGYRHSGVDDGEGAGVMAKEAPVLVADGLFDAPSVSQRFDKAAENLPAEIRGFVLGKLRGM